MCNKFMGCGINITPHFLYADVYHVVITKAYQDTLQTTPTMLQTTPTMLQTTATMLQTTTTICLTHVVGVVL